MRKCWLFLLTLLFVCGCVTSASAESAKYETYYVPHILSADGSSTYTIQLDVGPGDALRLSSSTDAPAPFSAMMWMGKHKDLPRVRGAEGECYDFQLGHYDPATDAQSPLTCWGVFEIKRDGPCAFVYRHSDEGQDLVHGAPNLLMVNAMMMSGMQDHIDRFTQMLAGDWYDENGKCVASITPGKLNGDPINIVYEYAGGPHMGEAWLQCTKADFNEPLTLWQLNWALGNPQGPAITIERFGQPSILLHKAMG